MNLPPSPSSDDASTALRAFLLAILPSGVEVVQAQDNRVPEPAGPDFVTINEVGRTRLSTNVTTYADCHFAGSAVGSILTVASVAFGTVAAGRRLLGPGIADGTAVGPQQSGTPGGAGTYALTVAQPAPVQGVPLAAGAALIAQPTAVTVQVDLYGPGSADNTATVTTLLRDDYASLWFARAGWHDRGVDILDVGDPRQMAFTDGESQYEDRFSLDVKLQVDQVTSPSQDFADALSVDIRPPADNPAH